MLSCSIDAGCVSDEVLVHPSSPTVLVSRVSVWLGNGSGSVCIKPLKLLPTIIQLAGTLGLTAVRVWVGLGLDIGVKDKDSGRARSGLTVWMFVAELTPPLV